MDTIEALIDKKADYFCYSIPRAMRERAREPMEASITRHAELYAANRLLTGEDIFGLVEELKDRQVALKEAHKSWATVDIRLAESFGILWLFIGKFSRLRFFEVEGRYQREEYIQHFDPTA